MEEFVIVSTEDIHGELFLIVDTRRKLVLNEQRTRVIADLMVNNFRTGVIPVAGVWLETATPWDGCGEIVG